MLDVKALTITGIVWNNLKRELSSWKRRIMNQDLVSLVIN